MGTEKKVLTVGYCMKRSRQQEFVQRGAFPSQPTSNGLHFVPIDLDAPLERQLASIDVLLHKATDEIVSVSGGGGGQVDGSSDGYTEEHPELCVVDPMPAVMPLLDRVRTQEVLRRLPSGGPGCATRVRAPWSFEVASLDEPAFLHALESRQVSAPAIVKPRVACGAPEAHTMAIVFDEEGFRDLRVPMPATVQEYVDHGAWQYKCYMLGGAMFVSKRRSTPNVALLAQARSPMAGTAGTVSDPHAIVFDSLKSLPTNTKNESQTAPPASPVARTAGPAAGLGDAGAGAMEGVGRGGGGGVEGGRGGGERGEEENCTAKEGSGGGATAGQIEGRTAEGVGDAGGGTGGGGGKRAEVGDSCPAGAEGGSGAATATSVSAAAATGAGADEECKGPSEEGPSFDLAAVKAAGEWLRRHLRLTLFGFDVVVKEGTTDYVIIDVNYFPSFKDVPNAQALPALWAALRMTHDNRRVQ
eukprot:jgi/Mesen1/9700/ME000069S09110